MDFRAVRRMAGKRVRERFQEEGEMTEEQHRKDCLRRHYEQMNKARAYKLKGSLTGRARAVFVKRINTAKGFEFIS